MPFTVNKARVKAEREEFERLSEELREYLTKTMKKGEYYTPVGLHNLANEFLREKCINLSEENVGLLLVYSDPILERTITLRGTYIKLRPQT